MMTVPCTGCALGLMCLATFGAAQTAIVFPRANATRPGSGFLSDPFVWTNSLYQQFVAEAKGRRFLIRGLSFRRWYHPTQRFVAPARTLELELRLGLCDMSNLSAVHRNNWVGTPTLAVARRRVSLPDWTPIPTRRPTRFTLSIKLDRPVPRNGTHALLWEIRTFLNTQHSRPYPADFDGAGRIVRAYHRQTSHGCLTGNNWWPMTTELDFASTLTKTTLTIGSRFAPPRAPVLVMLGARDPYIRMPWCDDIRSSAEVLLLAGISDAAGHVTNTLVLPGWRSSWKSLTMYAQAVAPERRQAGGFAFGFGRAMTIWPYDAAATTLRHLMVWSMTSSFGDLRNGGVVFRVD